MPTLDFIDIGDVTKSEYFRGVISSINALDDTCVVNANGAELSALIFYH
jgi:hypothetical protein